MRFLVDECCGPAVVLWLRSQGNDTKNVAEAGPGMEDARVLEWAGKENRILVTADKDFGSRVFERGEPHAGVILLRVEDERPEILVKALSTVIERFGEKAQGRFIVASERRIRPDH